MILNLEMFKDYITLFNKNDEENVIQHINNDSAFRWLEENIPLLECPDKEIEEAYYFRWWVFRKHIKQTEDGFVITEFHPDVPWAGKYNTIVCPAGHHFYEGRWLHDSTYLSDYARFWFAKGGDLRSYSTWLSDSVWKQCLVSGDFSLAEELLPQFIQNYYEWEKSHLHSSGLFWSIDDRDGGEFSISGNGLRPTLNSYMFADAMAIVNVAEIVNYQGIADEFREKALAIKQSIEEKLWDSRDEFFKVFPLDSKDEKIEGWSFNSINEEHNVRELHGYIPWYFEVLDEKYDVAWKQLIDSKGFYAPYGPTTAEQRHPRFMFEAKHQCLWNGPSWPFLTSFVIGGLANLLNHHQCTYVNKNDYFKLLKIYTKCHKRKKNNGETVSWIDENLDPYTGEWLARSILEKRGWPDNKGGQERAKDYNHSSYCDLIINGLVGLKPHHDNRIEVNPLVPEDTWDYFSLDNVLYHGRVITILYDKKGDHYKKGQGLQLYIDGELVAKSSELKRLICRI
ncbi:MGH1-like glycoside hydrolase domain-containing protein [Vallitalea okinawensis]|uniref:MGH1-like glycoside hydrolase domain-containing protein n=1 Tax=Vallitalea okinawensis TaxID=2078660 RepID=UPI001A9A60E1|nr:glycosyl hydrolase family 65 protein [Vallitalea okinawensis]